MKKNLMNRIVILLLLLAAVPVSVHAAVIPPEWEGDVNLDGEVDISDATYLINGLLNEVIVPSMDVNQDGVINITDATCLINMLLNMPSATETYVVNGVSFKMIYVRAGSYEMGATDEQTGATQDEYPPHLVQLTPYYIGETEVSQELWYAVMGDNPSYSKGYNLPVEQITWDECQEFVNRLSQITGRQFRLPTEAEWEFAARGAHKSGGFLYSGSNILSQVGWYDTNSGGKMNLIKQLMGNERQLYDMSGNVWEWCQDWFGDYSDDHQLDPKGPAEGLERVVRGGGWEAPDAFCRVAYRKGQAPGQPDEHIGLRLAMDVYDTYWLTLSSRVVSMEVGESRSVNILNGSGDYTIYNNNAEIVNCTLNGETLNISGLSVGTTTITVVDNLTHCQVDVTAIVYEHVEPSTFVVNGVEFSVNFVQGGNYVMGGTSEQGSDAQGFERPAHYVTLSDYYMGATEVTQALWHAVMGNNPSYFAGVDHLNYPVEQVTWDECQEFVCRLSEITGRTFRMPTEAEWEFAARGGLKSHGYKYAGGDLLDLVAWHSGNAFAVGASSPDYGTHAVATKAPNELGLYDMSGNVMEWCLDLSATYTTDTQVNPAGPYSGTNVVGRGGSWQSSPANCRVSSRHSLSPESTNLSRGLRVVMEPATTSSSHFDVYQRTICVQVGTTRQVDILNGSGDYLIYNRIPDFATCSVIGEQIEVTGVSAGTDIIAVKDKQTGAETWFTVIVKGPLSLSKNEMTLRVGQTDSVYIINGNGRYLIESDSTYVTTTLISNRLKITGVAPGTTTVSVTDLSINATVSLDVTIREPSPATVEEIIVKDVKFNMITVQGGSFIMGEMDTDANAYYSGTAKPPHIVTLSSYCIGETEVTQELWTAIMGSNPSYNNDNIHKPVERVSWSSCHTFINKLNELTGRRFRLPTEAEWEFAARGGNKSRGYMYSGSDNIDEVGWYSGNTANSYPTGCAVAQRAPNELGIYDMSGSASEICSDRYDGDYYSIEPQINPTGPDSSSGSSFVVRGGNRESSASYCTVWYRSSVSYSTSNISYTGLRLAMDLEEDTIPLPTFGLSENFVTIEVGENKSIGILNGGGNYTISSSADILSVNANGNTLSITGLEIGISYITIVDNESGERSFLTVIVSGETFTVNGASFKMMYVKGDKFQMGASDDDANAGSDEKPAHWVTLNSYRLGQTEVTQELWQAVMGKNPSKYTGDMQRPVEQVSWNDCQAFILRLNQLTGKHFRMPTEAEWEFAAKGGFMSHGYKYSGSDTIDNVAWCGITSSSSQDYCTYPVATKSPNELGIYDMTGNVEEWCQDWFSSYTTTALTNTTGPSSYSGGMAIPQRIRRGGAFYYGENSCRITIRRCSGQKEYFYAHGLRLALDMDNTPKVHFSESVVTVPLGETITVNVQNNTRDYTIAGGTDCVVTSVNGNTVTITGTAVGTTSIHLTESGTGYTAALPVIVGYANPPEPTIEEETFTVNGVPFKMVTVEGGTFRMGNAEYSSQRPVHQVTLTSYKIGNTEVTQALWQAVMGCNPSFFSGNLQRPVELVSWADCQEFIYKLNQLTGKKFRLPTEAEWEFAARGGNYSHGYPYSGSDVMGDVAWYIENAYDVGSDSPDYGTHEVATKLPNELGLYDMTGNVSEWCIDWHSSYTSSAQTDPIGPATGTYRAFRPTGWKSNTNLEFSSVTARSNDFPYYPRTAKGLRLALDVDDNPKLHLSETVIIVKVGETKTIDIINGTGSYSVSGGTANVTPKISSGSLKITGKAVGTTTVCVNSKAVISVIVVSSNAPDNLGGFVMEDWEDCDYGNVYLTENNVQGHQWKWDFSNANIFFDNDKNSDLYHGKLVCRFRDTITMAEDFNGHTRAFGFFASAYSSNANATLRVDYSTDQGQTWTSLGSVTVQKYVFQNYIFGVEVDGSVRFRIVKTSGNNVDIDDIAIYN